MGTTPEELRREIEVTRHHLTLTVDRLADRVSPGSMAHRRARDTKRRLRGLRASFTGRVHGAADGVRGSVVHPRRHRAAVQPLPGTGQVVPQHSRLRRASVTTGLLVAGTGLAAGALLLRARPRPSPARRRRPQRG
ncbi:DUF3618 domain-containing protein [Streptomyces sp. NPDC092296]|uniref:DUF3618 domain-containing protein n=1 Tax=Streptomyces sp. NPDC092296 TaxID=3366012 RepID=UPI003825715C